MHISDPGLQFPIQGSPALFCFNPPTTPSFGARRHEEGIEASIGEAAAEASSDGEGEASQEADVPGARLTGLLHAIFTGKWHNSARQHRAPQEDEPAMALSTTRPCSARTLSARPRASRSRTIRFLDIDGEVVVAAAAVGCRRVPVVVEEVLFWPADGGDVGEVARVF
jgi:hypothetical protein